MIDREPPVTEDELHAYVDGELAADRRAAVEPGLPAMPTMPRASPPGARRPRRSARATARSRASRCRRVSISSGSRAPGRKWSRLAAAAVVARLPRRRRRRLVRARRLGRRGPGTVVTTEALDAHRLYIAEVRHPIEVKAGESHLIRGSRAASATTMRAPDLDALRAEAARRPAAAGQAGRPPRSNV